jgi:hypothetical protein
MPAVSAAFALATGAEGVLPAAAFGAEETGPDDDAPDAAVGAAETGPDVALLAAAVGAAATGPDDDVPAAAFGAPETGPDDVLLAPAFGAADAALGAAGTGPDGVLPATALGAAGVRVEGDAPTITDGMPTDGTGGGDDRFVVSFSAAMSRLVRRDSPAGISPIVVASSSTSDASAADIWRVAFCGASVPSVVFSPGLWSATPNFDGAFAATTGAAGAGPAAGSLSIAGKPIDVSFDECADDIGFDGGTFVGTGTGFDAGSGGTVELFGRAISGGVLGVRGRGSGGVLGVRARSPAAPGIRGTMNFLPLAVSETGRGAPDVSRSAAGSPRTTHSASAFAASIRPPTAGTTGRGSDGTSAGRGGTLGGAGFIASRAFSSSPITILLGSSGAMNFTVMPGRP